jgi:hypothetical protein
VADGVPVLVEAYVVECTANELRRRGWAVTPVQTTATHGVDIVATRGDVRLHIEAKGAGSSRPGSSRYGKSFNSGQVDICVAKACHKALEALSAGYRAAVAFPDNAAFRARVRLVELALARLEVGVFWVSEDQSVNVDNDHFG